MDAPTVGIAPEVERALAALSPRERACAVLRHMENLSTRETAHLLGLSEGAVKRYVADGVAALAAALGAEPAEHVPVTSPTRPAVPGAAGRPGPDGAPRRISTRKAVGGDV